MAGMRETEKFYPKSANFGKNCTFWSTERCIYPKEELIGRRSCEGIVDDVCLLVLNGRRPKSLTQEQIREIKINPPSIIDGFSLPPGDIIP